MLEGLGDCFAMKNQSINQSSNRTITQQSSNHEITKSPNVMNAVVVHYKELALKGKNRPWFIQVLIRNLKTALAGLHVRAFRSSMGRLEIELGPDTPWPEAQARLA